MLPLRGCDLLVDLLAAALGAALLDALKAVCAAVPLIAGCGLTECCGNPAGHRTQLASVVDPLAAALTRDRHGGTAPLGDIRSTLVTEGFQRLAAALSRRPRRAAA